MENERLSLLLAKASQYTKFLASRMNFVGMDDDVKNEKESIVSSSITAASVSNDSNDSSENKSNNNEEEEDSDSRKVDGKKRKREWESSKSTPSSASASESTGHNQPKSMTGGVMKDYQINGFRWLVGLWENGLHGILGDEMGLGKTVQSIALLAHLRDNKVKGPYLIVVPLSTLPNWVREFNKWVPSFPVVQYYGSQEERTKIMKKQLHPFLPISKSSSNNINSDAPVVITTYEMVSRDKSMFQRFEWQYLIIDEGHRLKNMNCKLIQDLNKILSRSPTVSKLLLTGTPLQNNLTELWSLLHFLLPKVFDDVEFFKSVFALENAVSDDPNKTQEEFFASTVNKLHIILRPFMMRRLKSEVEKNIPKKAEVVIYTPMSPEQTEMYNAIISGKLKEMLLDATGNKVALNNAMMQLRKCANHPYLHFEAEKEAKAHHTDMSIVNMSGKLSVLDVMLKELKKKGHKVLIFTQMTRILDILEDYLINIHPNYKYCRLDGSTHFTLRQEMVDKFNNDKNYFIFMLSTRAGGQGINLTSADTVIVFDSDWNPHQDNQAQDRCHRIGQTRDVVVYRLITAKSIEMRMLKVANSKRKLERVVCAEKGIHTTLSTQGSKKDLGVDELRALLQDDFSGHLKHDTGVIDTDFLVKNLLNRKLVIEALDSRGFDNGEENEEDIVVISEDGSSSSNDDCLPLVGNGYEIVFHKASSIVGEV